MKVLVTFKSGTRKLFVIIGTILVTDFQMLAEPIGGKIKHLEFL